MTKRQLDNADFRRAVVAGLYRTQLKLLSGIEDSLAKERLRTLARKQYEA